MTDNSHTLHDELKKMTNSSEYRYNVQYKYTGDSQRIEQWLDNNCSGAYDFVIEKPTSGRYSAGNIQLRFENEIDRTKFRDMILNSF